MYETTSGGVPRGARVPGMAGEALDDHELLYSASASIPPPSPRHLEHQDNIQRNLARECKYLISSGNPPKAPQKRIPHICGAAINPRIERTLDTEIHGILSNFPRKE